MTKLRFWFSLVSKLLTGTIAGLAFLAQISSLGASAWRLLQTWLFFLATVYFLLSALAEWFYRKQALPHRSFCSLLQGLIIVVSIGLGILRIFYQTYSIEWLGSQGFIDYLQLFGIALLTIGDWLFFTKKGNWNPSYPWHWLGIVISYCCVILLTADFVSDQQKWAYPYYFLNYPKFGVDSLVLWALLISVIILIMGYVLTLLDYAMSGQLNQHIVMPKIKTIVIEEPLVVEPEPVTESAVRQVKRVTKSKPLKPDSEPSFKSKSTPKPKPEGRPNMDIIKPVEGLKDGKSAQKIHHTNRSNTRSKSEIIADMRVQVSGNKNSKLRSRSASRSGSSRAIKKF